MVGGTTVNQLKEQLETSQAKNRAVQGRLEVKVEELDEKIGKIQASMDLMMAKYDDQMAWMKQQFASKYDSGTTSMVKESRDRGLLYTPGNMTTC